MLNLIFLLLLSSPSMQRCPEGTTATGYGPPQDLAWRCVKLTDNAPTTHGWSVEFWPNGNKKSACEYYEGELHGKCSRWSDQGNLVSRGHYNRGAPIGYWWFWGLLEDILFDPDGAKATLQLDETLRKFGAIPNDVPALAEFIVERYADPLSDIRQAPQLCTSSACVSVATINSQVVLAIQFEPPKEKLGTGEDELIRLAKQGKKRRQKISQLKKRRDQKHQKALKKHKQRVRSWEYTSLLCNDGTRSPSCVCGGGTRGCCSHHGGINGCPRDYPDEPERDTSPLMPNPLISAEN